MVGTREAHKVVTIDTPKGWRMRKGKSVSVDGICSTVIKASRDTFEVWYMPETLKKTTARDFAPGNEVNLELPLQFGARLDGHLVQGHVDTIGIVENIRRERNSRVCTIKIPTQFGRYIAPKGSICINGVSLTVVDTEGKSVIVALTAHTLKATNLGKLRKREKINIEIDILARYLERFIHAHATKGK